MLPVVMPANNPDTARELNGEFPGRLGTLLAPGTWRDPTGIPYVLDNGRFAVWSSGKKWNEKTFLELLDRAKDFGTDPQWIVVPDVMQDGEATLKEWGEWYDHLKGYGWNLALAVQQGITPEIVKGLHDQPDVIFVGGGNTEWKWRYVRSWCQSFPRVHIGQVGTIKRLWMAQDVGAESSDSNVWRPIGRHLHDLRQYLQQSQDGRKSLKGFGLCQ